MSCNASSSKFFANKDCEYYPCHKTDFELNCMFCYCPMYMLDNCPGNYKWIEKPDGRLKSCIDCTFPHDPDNYDKIMAVLAANIKKTY